MFKPFRTTKHQFFPFPGKVFKSTHAAHINGHRHAVRVPKIKEETSKRRGYLRNQVQSFGVQHSKVHREFTDDEVFGV